MVTGRFKGLVLNDFRVQEIVRGTGRRMYTIVDPQCRVHDRADAFLRTCAGGTDRTYAHLLVDHLRWLAYEGLVIEQITVQDLHRYMGAVGAEFAGPYGLPWRAGKTAYGPARLEGAAACLKKFYTHLGTREVNTKLAADLTRRRLPTKADRERMLLGHSTSRVPSNPIAPTVSRRRHPKLAPEGARAGLVAVLPKARDRMAVTWLADGGFRIGELCGLHLVDLHLREGADCGQCRPAHVHICHRELNPNRARAKTKHPWKLVGATITGGLVRRASPAMVHTYFEYMSTEYPADVDHGMLLVQLHGRGSGQPWSTTAARRVVRRAGRNLGLTAVHPHQFRHRFATEVLEASGGNTVIARDAGGWSSATTVEQVYAHTDVDDPAFAAALDHVWGQR